MNMINKLTSKNLKLNKKRSIVTIVGITLSVALITAVLSLVVSFRASIINFQKITDGNYHYGFLDVKKDDLSKFKNNRNIESYYVTNNIGYAKVDSKNENKPYAFIIGMDDNAFKNMSINLISGEYPKNENEIVIPSHLKTNGRLDYKIGDVITLDIGSRILNDEEVSQEVSYDSNEKFISKYSKTYKIVGISERPGYSVENYTAPGYTFITTLDNSSNIYNIYTRYTKKALNNQYKITANFLGIDSDFFDKVKGGYIISNESEQKKYIEELVKAKYEFVVNRDLIRYEYNNIEDGSMRAIYLVAFIVMIIIIFTSVFCIKNSFDISITEKTKQYGMLRSIGATSKQIKKNIYYEAFILGVIGLVLGLVFGSLAAYILIHVINYYLCSSDMMQLSCIYKFSFLSILLSIFLSFITIYLSSRKIAKKTSKISPIEAIRGSDDIKIKRNKIKTNKLIKKIFGIGGDIADKNIKRNKKKYRTTVISIIVCVSVFISLSTFIELGLKMVKVVYGDMSYNVQLTINNYNEHYDKYIDKILNLEDNLEYTYKRENYFVLDNANYNKKYPYKSDDGKLTLEVVSLGNDEYKRYVNKLNLNYVEVKDKSILINNDMTYINHGNKVKQTEINIFNYKSGNILSGKIDDKDYNFIVSKVTNERPMSLENYYGTAFLIVNDSIMDEIGSKNNIKIYFNSKNPDKLQDDIDKILVNEEYNLENFNTSLKQMKSFYTLVAIFLYGFIIVIALIGVTNIFNTITTSISLRSREFAMLKSIGMTKKEFNRMIRLESTFYCFKSLVIGIPIGIVLSYLIFKALSSGSVEIMYSLPVIGILISLISVLLLIYFIMKYSVNKINKNNIIDTIRNENI